jgi:hypothetical protein
MARNPTDEILYDGSGDPATRQCRLMALSGGEECLQLRYSQVHPRLVPTVERVKAPNIGPGRTSVITGRDVMQLAFLKVARARPCRSSRSSMPLEIGSLLKKVTGSRYISDGKVDVIQFHNLPPSLNIVYATLLLTAEKRWNRPSRSCRATLPCCCSCRFLAKLGPLADFRTRPIGASTNS